MSPLYLIGIAFWLCLNLLLCKQYGSSRLRAALYTLSFFYAVIGALIGGLFYRFVCRITGSPNSSSLVAIFGGVVFTPLLIMLTTTVEKAIRGALNKKRNKQLSEVSVRDTLDLQTPGCLAVLAVSKFICHIEGCCYGIPYAHGIYSSILKTTVFPVQIAEATSIVLVLIAVMALRKHKAFRRGMMYPLAAALYCAIRFFWEFYRYYPEQMRHLVLGMTLWQAVSLAVFIVSVVLLVVLYKKEPAARTKQILHHKKKRS